MTTEELVRDSLNRATGILFHNQKKTDTTELALVYRTGEFWCSGHPSPDAEPYDFVKARAQEENITLKPATENTFTKRFWQLNRNVPK